MVVQQFGQLACRKLHVAAPGAGPLGLQCTPPHADPARHVYYTVYYMQYSIIIIIIIITYSICMIPMQMLPITVNAIE